MRLEHEPGVAMTIEDPSFDRPQHSLVPSKSSPTHVLPAAGVVGGYGADNEDGGALGPEDGEVPLGMVEAEPTESGLCPDVVYGMHHERTIPNATPRLGCADYSLSPPYIAT